MPSYNDINSFSSWTKEEKDQFTIAIIKGLIMDTVRNANSGHTGGPMSSTDFSYILFSVIDFSKLFMSTFFCSLYIS